MVGLSLLLALAAPLAAAPHRGKPTAPVTLRLDVARAGDGYRVTLTATPTRDVPSLELMLDGTRRAFGATAAGASRTLAVDVRLAPGAGRDVIGAARAGGRSRATSRRVGTAAPRTTRRVVTRTLPDGRTVGEVR